jgi:putative ABC transport system permease protein
LIFKAPYGGISMPPSQKVDFYYTRLAGKESNEGSTGHGLAEALKEEFPEILQTVRLGPLNDEIEISYKEIKHNKNQGGRDLVFADNDIFKIFDIVLSSGDSETALLDPNSIILTEEESKNYFGSENPIGEFVNIHFPDGYREDLNLKVTGIAKAMPHNSNFEFSYIVPHANNQQFRYWPFVVPIVNTYLTLPPEYPPEDLEDKFQGIVRKYFASEIEKKYSTTYDDWLEADGYWKLELQPLNQVHLNKHSFRELPIIKKGNLFHVQIYTVIALFIIALACINFITLSTARVWGESKGSRN